MKITHFLGGVAATALIATAAAAQTESAPAQFERAVRETRAEMLKAGPVVPGWNVGGADPDAALEAAGPDRHILLVEEGDERHVEIRTDRRIAELAPAAWRPIDSYGSPVAFAEFPIVAFAPLGTGYAVGMRTHRWRENGLSCDKSPAHAILYEIPGAAKPDLDREGAIGMFRIVMLAIEGQTVCARATGDREKGWRIRLLLPDGRDLPTLNETETRVRIVAAAPVESLVRGAPLVAPAPEPTK